MPGAPGSGRSAARPSREMLATPTEGLEDVAQIHPSITTEFEVGAVQDWYGDQWARGALALFEPAQQTRLQDAITAPEGRVPFAGEHTSLYHAWIQGTLESGIRAAKEIHARGIRLSERGGNRLK